MKQDLLIEIGTEELPPKALLQLSEAFQQAIASLLDKAGLAHDGITPFATPRRLALIVSQLPAQQPDISLEKLGPAVQASFGADGKPTKAAEGFARGCGVDVSALERKMDGNVEKLAFRSQRKGAATATLIPDMVREALAALPIPKRMRWGSSRDEFVRPVQWCVLLFGDAVIPATILGAESAAVTRGHRFMHPQPITLSVPADYEQALMQGKVVANFAQRRDTVRKLVEEEGRKLGAQAIIEEALLDEVTALVEWPVALTGRFDNDFLSVPQEALISAMKGHQKCFHLLDPNGNILPHFITLSNLVSRDPAQVIAGNEKVIRPRLADAAFFFSQDKKQPLAARREKLKTVIFQQELGTLADKSERVAKLAQHIALQLGADAKLAQRAAELGKCDLLTSMVYEFAELQGLMGMHYAKHDGEPDDVAQALFEQYLPRFSGDELPQTQTGMVLALAERLDTITGLFGIGQPPTGSKDPFALRRAALGVLRIVIEKQLPLDLSACLDAAVANFGALPKAQNLAATVRDFIFDRLRTFYTDQGVSADVFLAVDAVRPASPLEFDARIKAVSNFVALSQAQALAAANKRVSNILQKTSVKAGAGVDAAKLQEPAEQALSQAVQSVQARVEPLLKQNDFTPALAAMAELQAVVDAFFDKVMVNVDDAALRDNRLALLQQLRALFLRVADISLLQNV
ncbi:MAG TPA: glycine--tRNA ligase subunit beta [Pseudomonadales bacterium]